MRSIGPIPVRQVWWGLAGRVLPGPVRVTRAGRWYVLASIGFLVVWQAGVVLEVPRGVAVVLGVYGFVLHMVFGKGYSLIPAYFDREFRVWWAPVVQLPLTIVGAAGLAAAAYPGVPGWIAVVAGACWFVGVLVFVGAIGWTIRTNPVGRQTGTGAANRERAPVDRWANAFLPVALGYLLVGSYGTVAVAAGWPWMFDGYRPRITHLLAAGTGVMLVFAVGFRLLPRFLAATPPRRLVPVVLVAGAVGPVVLAGSLGHGGWFRVGAVVQTVAVVGFAVGVGVLFRRSERRRVGGYGVLVGVGFGVVGSGLGVLLAFGEATAGMVVAHARVNLLGFLGLVIVGVVYQFYPPRIGGFPLAGSSLAYASIVVIAAGLVLEVVGAVGGIGLVGVLGRMGVLAGVVVFAYLVVGLFWTR